MQTWHSPMECTQIFCRRLGDTGLINTWKGVSSLRWTAFKWYKSRAELVKGHNGCRVNKTYLRVHKVKSEMPHIWSLTLTTSDHWVFEQPPLLCGQPTKPMDWQRCSSIAQKYFSEGQSETLQTKCKYMTIIDLIYKAKNPPQAWDSFPRIFIKLRVSCNGKTE